MIDPEDVLTFWLEECEPADWYKSDPKLDATIRTRFGAAWDAARQDKLAHWAVTARGALALLILTDQFSRNMFRGTAQAFATDPLARSVVYGALSRGLDTQIEGAGRQFFYLPLEHSESLQDQSRAVRMILTRMDAPETLLHARAHREVIRRFGRFPFRNDALGRRTSSAEQAFLDSGSYGAVVRDLQAEG
ncbi:DUF924 family protein [Jannaschia pohangensis]|uniref:Uncharacterized conserved protein, DUF924 family n=1 Tax=Jannaschia pohangensis TaxID=390807 RepID=A0A1I3I3Z9_9RHOB|nr:DUF924 family protein [Jannaschia pohangensis]SFI42696.1 Uncharacterized conserved protein, DUF924 family [Jannaschia pohangensis]